MLNRKVMKNGYKKNRSGGVYNLWSRESGIKAMHNDRDIETGLYYNEHLDKWGKYISKKVMKGSSDMKMYDFKFYALEKIKDVFGELKVERLGVFFSLLYERTMIERYDEDWKGVYLSTDDLKRVIGEDWNKVIIRLFNNEILDINKRVSKYRGDRLLRYFKLNNEFFKEVISEVRKVELKDERFEKSMREYYSKNCDNRTGIMKKVEVTLDKCDLVINDLDVVIDELLRKRLEKDLLNLESEFVSKHDKQLIRNKLVNMDAYEREYKGDSKQLYYCLRGILEKEIIEERRSFYRINKDEFGGRLYHLFSNIPKDYRKRLTIDGEDVIEIDIKASQPSFLCLLFERGTSLEFTKGIFDKHNNEEYVRVARENEMDVYRYMAVKLKGEGFEKDASVRANMKILFFKMVFRKPKKTGGKGSLKDVCDKLFGKSFYRFLYDLANMDLGEGLDKNHKNLAYLLQKVESRFLNYLMIEMGDIAFLPIHDSLLVKKSDAAKVREIFKKVCLLYTSPSPRDS